MYCVWSQVGPAPWLRISPADTNKWWGHSVVFRNLKEFLCIHGMKWGIGYQAQYKMDMIINYILLVILVDALVRQMIQYDNVRKCAHHGQNSVFEYSVVINIIDISYSSTFYKLSVDR